MTEPDPDDTAGDMVIGKMALTGAKDCLLRKIAAGWLVGTDAEPAQVLCGLPGAGRRRRSSAPGCGVCKHGVCDCTSPNDVQR